MSKAKESFKAKHTFEKRKEEAERILAKYPQRIPVICEKDPRSRDIPNIDRQKYLVPDDLSVANFITECYERGVRNALIIHGMGRDSKPHPALLKSLCAQWLPQLEPVLALHSARPEHGGAGACYVIIRKNTAAKIANKELNRRR